MNQLPLVPAEREIDGIPLCAPVHAWFTQRFRTATEPQRRAYVDQCLAGRSGPAVASSDYIRTFADQIRPFVPGRYVVLGTDGFGRSDYRAKLRRFFEVDRHHVVVAALKALADEGTVEPAVVQSAIERYEIDTEEAPPWAR